MVTENKTSGVRTLTHDEKKAAEAAFRGAPFNPKWSEAARKVYQGIAEAMAARPSGILSQLAAEDHPSSARAAVSQNKLRSRTKTKIQ